MFKFDSDHILTGHIKQVLNSFNLPSYKIYTKKHEQYFNEHQEESPELANGLYLKDGIVCEFKNGKWVAEHDVYGYNNKILNITKTLPIYNNKYDSDTHEYLGEFLRFQRDYLGIDLMPLYNCFSNSVCNHIKASIYEPGTTKIQIRNLLDTRDAGFVIYKIPIKFFKEYTIAIDCALGIDVCCGLFTDYIEKYEDEDYKDLIDAQLAAPEVNVSQFLLNRTFKKIKNLKFNDPILWKGIDINTFNEVVNDCVTVAENLWGSDGETDRATRAQIYRQRLFNKEGILKLFIKVPVNVKSSITVLEGDYRDFNNSIYKEVYKPVFLPDGTVSKTAKKYWEKQQNHFITNYETLQISEDKNDINTPIINELPEVEDRPFRPISPLQLLMLNTGTSYPFADRLIEYLLGNVINEWDEITDNIKRVQKVLEMNNNKFAIKGAWEGKMRNMLYDYMMTGKPSGEQFPSSICHDVLGYVDKDVEKFYAAWDFEYCKDDEGNLIPLTEKIIDENGEEKEVVLYRLVDKLLLEGSLDAKLLTDTRDFLLTTRDKGAIPLYKQRFTAKATIANVDIYTDEEDN